MAYRNLKLYQMCALTIIIRRKYGMRKKVATFSFWIENEAEYLDGLFLTSQISILG